MINRRSLAVLFTFCLIFTLISVHVSADSDAFESETPPSLTVDDMTSRFAWTSSSLSVTRAAYTDETAHMASSEDDGGYLLFSASGVGSGKELSARRAFDVPVNLYRFKTLSFDYFITPQTTENVSVAYTFTVTLYSGTSSVSTSFAAITGEWAKAEIPVESWNRRSTVDAVSVALTPVCESESDAKFPVIFRLDGMTAEGVADTAYEDSFMTSSFSVKDGSVTNYQNGIVLWRRAAYSSISANISYSDANEALGHNALRVVLSVGTDTELRFTAVYADGTVYESKAQTIAAGDDPVACYFTFPSPEKALRFAIVSDTRLGGTVTLYGIDTVYLPTHTTGDELGTLDVCAFGADGSLNLRGTVTSDAVVEHIGGTIRIYAVPIYASVESAVLSSDPIAETTMTTRFNLTVDPSSLPDGAAAMRYAVIIADRTSLISVCAPILPDTEKAGVTIPSRSDSLKGICSADIDHEAGLTEIKIDLDTIFGSPSSSKIYSAFGELYYFDSDVLARLDSEIKAVSLAGTNVYLRFYRTNESASASLISVDSKEAFRELYAAVDFLTARYSSDDYGYVSGVIVGESVTDDSNCADDAKKISSVISSAAVISGAGGMNLADFKVILPLGDSFITVSPSLDSAELTLRLIANYTDSIGLSDYGIMWQTDSVASSSGVYGASSVDSVAKYASSLAGNAPKYYFVRYTPADIGYPSAESLLKSTARAYFAVCEQSSVQGLILDISFLPDVAVGGVFTDIFARIDTNEYSDAFSSILYPGEELTFPSSAAEKRAFPRAVSEIEPKISVSTLGSAAILDYSSSFYTGGWFPLTDLGECMTVKADFGRVMRFSDGIMYSCPSSPLDLSQAPVISFELYADSPRVYTLTLISKSASVSAEFTVTESSDTVFFDLSDFDGISAVTGILLRPRDNESGFLYIKNMSAGSFLLTDDELRETFSSSAISGSDSEKAPEENIVEIIAVISVAAVISALALSLLRRKEH